MLTKRVWILAAILALPAFGCEGKPKAKPSISTDESGSSAPGALETRKIATH